MQIKTMKSEEKIFRNMKREFIMLCLGIVIAMFFVFVFSSCGARKVEKKQIKEQTEKKQKIVTENDITATDNITVTSKSFVIDSTKEEIEEIEIIPIDLLKPAYYENKELKNTKLVKRKIKRNKAILGTNNTNTKHDSKKQGNSKKTIEKANKRTKDEKNKESERKFNMTSFIFYLALIIFLIFILYMLYKKYKDKVTFI